MKSKELLEQLKAARASLKSYKEARLGASTGTPAGNTKGQEMAACAKFGVKSLNELIKINTASRNFRGIAAEDREAVKSLKEAVDVCLMSAKVFGVAPQSTK